MKKLTILFFVGFLFTFQAIAQKEDPRNKPYLWLEIKMNPADRTLWAEYYDRPTWDELSLDELKEASNLREDLLRRLTMNKDTTYEHPFNSWEHLVGWEEMIMEDSHEIEDLKSNVAANFLIIEELFTSVFQELDLEYVPYKKVYPKANYSKIKWVEEHEEKVKMAKDQKIAQFRKQYNIHR